MSKSWKDLADYLRWLAHDCEVNGNLANNDKDRWKAFGKAEAYLQAAFEIERMEVKQ